MKMSPKTLFFTSLLVVLDVVSGLRLRAVEQPEGGEVFGYSVPKRIFKRQSVTCPIGTRQCAETATQIFCSAVCCYEDGEFVFGCRLGFYCVGSGADAGCCPTGRLCDGPPPPCVDAGEPAVSPTSACPLAQPTCTSNSLGAPICSGTGAPQTTTRTRSFTLTLTSTASVTSTFDADLTETETTTSVEFTTADEPTSTEETSFPFPTETFTIYPPLETTTTESSTVEFTTTVEITTAAPTVSSNVTLTPLPPATSNSGRTSTFNLLFGLIGVAFAFFLF